MSIGIVGYWAAAKTSWPILVKLYTWRKKRKAGEPARREAKQAKSEARYA